MLRLKTHKDHVLHRLKITRGQIEKTIQMVEGDRYCIDVLHSSLSVQKALKHIDSLIMEDHLRNCAIDQARNGKIDKLIHELVGIYKYKS